MSSQYSVSHNSSRCPNPKSHLLSNLSIPLPSADLGNRRHFNIPISAQDLPEEAYRHASVSPSFLPNSLFSVPAILIHISQTEPAFIFTFIHNGARHQAVLQQTFLTALDKDGVKVTWKQARNDLILGLEAKVDITQVKPANVEENWLVFGLYLNKRSTSSSPFQEEIITKVTSGKEKSLINSDWMERNGEDETFSDGSLDSSRESFKCFSEDDLELSSFKEGFSDGLEERNAVSPSCLPIHLSRGFNQTFTLDEEPSHCVQPRCVHKYEVGLVVVTISSQFLHLIVQVGDTWSRTEVDPITSLVFVEGVRTKEVYSIKMGAMGHMVVKECVKCQLDSASSISLSPILLWVGEDQSPTVREHAGVVVGREKDRMVVQLKEAEELVLFHGEIIKEQVQLQTKVLVWAWDKLLRGGAGSFLEGAALVVRQEVQEDDDAVDELCGYVKGISDGDNTFDLLELSTGGIFSPIRSKLVKDAGSYLLISQADIKEALDISLSVSFGSVSGESDDGNDDFSMMANPDFSNKHMEDVSLSDAKKNIANDVLNDIYFQALFWRSSSPKPDAIIDAQFETILAANDLLYNYSDLVTDYDQMFEDKVLSDPSTKLQTVRQSSNLSLSTDCQDFAGQFISFDDPVSPYVIDQSLVRKMSHPPLSPIPEEPTDREVSDNVEDPVFAGPSLASTPAGRSTDNSGAPVTPGSVSYGEITAMDSGFYESFFSGSNSDGLASRAKAKLVRNVLEQFLEFTKFPSERRPDVINSFFANSYKEEM